MIDIPHLCVQGEPFPVLWFAMECEPDAVQRLHYSTAAQMLTGFARDAGWQPSNFTLPALNQYAPLNHGHHIISTFQGPDDKMICMFVFSSTILVERHRQRRREGERERERERGAQKEGGSICVCRHCNLFLLPVKDIVIRAMRSSYPHVDNYEERSHA